MTVPGLANVDGPVLSAGDLVVRGPRPVWKPIRGGVTGPEIAGRTSSTRLAYLVKLGKILFSTLLKLY